MKSEVDEELAVAYDGHSKRSYTTRPTTSTVDEMKRAVAHAMTGRDQVSWRLIDVDSRLAKKDERLVGVETHVAATTEAINRAACIPEGRVVGTVIPSVNVNTHRTPADRPLLASG